jgi:hypothetical protein
MEIAAMVPMGRLTFGAVLGAVIFASGMAVPLVAGADVLPPGSFKIAQGGSCQSWFRTCTVRCKERAPLDKNCVADRCTPKLLECRQSGCWSEGALYGDTKQCGLAK